MIRIQNIRRCGRGLRLFSCLCLWIHSFYNCNHKYRCKRTDFSILALALSRVPSENGIRHKHKEYLESFSPPTNQRTCVASFFRIQGPRSYFESGGGGVTSDSKWGEGVKPPPPPPPRALGSYLHLSEVVCVTFDERIDKEIRSERFATKKAEDLRTKIITFH